MGKLSAFLSGQPGYFREGGEDEFPWDQTGKSVWYSLMVVEDGQIQRYGFTASKSGKSGLRSALEALEGAEALLLGVWTGQYSTHLFVLDIPKAVQKLSS